MAPSLTMRLGCAFALSGWIVAKANIGNLGDDSLLEEGVVSHKLVRDRIKEELAKLEAATSGHASTHESALNDLAKLHGANDIGHLKTMETDKEHVHHARAELAALENMADHEHYQMKLDNEAARERAMQELAKLENLHAGGEMTEESKKAHADHSHDLETLTIKQQIFDSKADHEAARKRVMGELAKLEAMHSHDTHQRMAVKGLNTKTAAAAKGLNMKKNAAPAHHALQKDAPPKRSAWGGLKSVLGMKVAEEAVAEDAGLAVNLMQTGAVVEPAAARPASALISNKRKKHQEL